MAQQVVRQQAVQPAATPGLILDVLDRVHRVELVEVGDAGSRLQVQARLVVGAGGELALDAAHAGNHGVDVLEYVVLRCAARDGRRGRVLEQRLEGRRILFDDEVGGAEVFAEELVGETQ